MTPPAIFVAVEDGHVLADDLVGRISLDSHRAVVPADDVALGREHEDGVVLDSRNEDSKCDRIDRVFGRGCRAFSARLWLGLAPGLRSSHWSNFTRTSGGSWRGWA